MKILEIKTLVFPEIKVMKFTRFLDNRGYFTELYKRSDFQKIDFLKDIEFLQNNGSFSKAGVIRGLHFQWNPYMNKLVKTISGQMIDLFLDIRVGSPNFGKIGAYNMNNQPESDYDQWIWIPVGFAHGNIFVKDTTIEYYCTAEYSPTTEASISPLSSDIDWSMIDKNLKDIYDQVCKKPNISEKDKNGFTLDEWLKDERSVFFTYS